MSLQEFITLKGKVPRHTHNSEAQGACCNCKQPPSPRSFFAKARFSRVWLKTCSLHFVQLSQPSVVKNLFIWHIMSPPQPLLPAHDLPPSTPRTNTTTPTITPWTTCHKHYRGELDRLAVWPSRVRSKAMSPTPSCRSAARRLPL